jgi:hypothetical protein
MKSAAIATMAIHVAFGGAATAGGAGGVVGVGAGVGAEVGGAAGCAGVAAGAGVTGVVCPAGVGVGAGVGAGVPGSCGAGGCAEGCGCAGGCTDEAGWRILLIALAHSLSGMEISSDIVSVVMGIPPLRKASIIRIALCTLLGALVTLTFPFFTFFNSSHLYRNYTKIKNLVKDKLEIKNGKYLKMYFPSQ